MDLLDIRHKQQIPFLIPTRDLERDDFAPVRETANAIHFLSFLEDEKMYEVTKEHGGVTGVLKLRFRHAPDLKEKLEELEKSGDIKLLDYHRATLVDICKVYKLTLRASTEDELDEAFNNQMVSWKNSLTRNVSQKLEHFNLIGITMGVQR